MQNFPCPPNHLKFFQVDRENILKNYDLFNSFPIHSVHLLIPAPKSFIENYEGVLNSDDAIYFLAKQITAASLIEEVFLMHFIKNGVLQAVPHNIRADNNFISITSTACVIEMKDSNFFPGKKLYKSVLHELTKIDDLRFDLLLSWKSNGDICSQSLKKYFENQGYECIAFEPTYRQSCKISVSVPIINFELFEPSVLEDVLEWIGAHICEIDFPDDADSYVSKFAVPKPSQLVDRLFTASWRGFFSAHQVFRLMEEMRKILEKNPYLPFVASLISGFQDCYVMYKGFEHLSSADKLICLILSRQCNYFVATLNIS
ncbi:ribonuclease P protein subunit p40-like isoform X2 [Stegodyphus dumicola]|uniref:ribonuclease P protein subunit p40-like isoform X2 n=1 Tax=Stegodyphus dumicola TaxID=202533 RepID=UPI0015AA9DA3|nr:ribonuclease P protein subunit p40-like isoform X2 [Stegodyphus dumicola]